MNDMTVIEQLQWRYAVKKFDPAARLDATTVELLLEATRLAPSAYGMQPYRVILVENPVVRKALVGPANGQTKVAEASHIIVFAVLSNIEASTVDAYVKRMLATRDAPPQSLAGFAGMLHEFVTSQSSAELEHWATHQAYLATGVLLMSCAAFGVDACPMEGFDPAAFDEVLQLPERNLRTKVIVALGRRDLNDPYATYPKVRVAADEFTIKL